MEFLFSTVSEQNVLGMSLPSPLPFPHFSSPHRPLQHVKHANTLPWKIRMNNYIKNRQFRLYLIACFMGFNIILQNMKSLMTSRKEQILSSLYIIVAKLCFVKLCQLCKSWQKIGVDNSYNFRGWIGVVCDIRKAYFKKRVCMCVLAYFFWFSNQP